MQKKEETKKRLTAPLYGFNCLMTKRKEVEPPTLRTEIEEEKLLDIPLKFFAEYAAATCSNPVVSPLGLPQLRTVIQVRLTP